MPEWRQEIRRRLAGARLGPEREAEIIDEVAQHLEDRYREHTLRGATPEEAAGRALSELDADGVLAREVARVEPAVRPLPPIGAPATGSFLASVVQDARYALRRLRGQPVFALTAIVTLALTIGPATAVVGIADRLFFRPISGVSESHRLVNVAFGRGSYADGYSPWFVSYANVRDMLSGSKAITAMTGVQLVSAGLSARNGEPRRVQGQAVQANYFSVLGVPLVAGRGFLDEEDSTPGGVASVVLAAPLARELFGVAEAAIGQRVQLNSEAFSVVGVTSAAFEGLDVDRWSPRFWITGMANKRLNHTPPARWPFAVNRGPFADYVVRIAPGATVESAFAELKTRAAALAEAGGEGSELFKTIGPIMQGGLGAPRSLSPNGVRAVRLLGVVAGVLILLGMANVANLLIFRGLKTGRDIAVRKALGASVLRLLQLTLVECVMLSVAGAAGGILLALGIQEFLSDIKVWGIGTVAVPLDWRVLGVTAGLAVTAAIGFGVGPALLSARVSLLAGLGRGVRNDAPRAGRLRQGLATVQLALSLALLVGALLFLSTLRNLRGVDLGIDPSGVTTMSLQLRDHGYDKPRTLAYEQQLIEQLRREPGLESVGITYNAPVVGGNYESTLYLPGQDPKKDAMDVMFNGATASFFDVFKMKLVRGRAFSEAEDFATTAGPVILSAAAAKHLFGETDPIGRTVLEGPRAEYTVIGVTADVRWKKIQGRPDLVAFLPWGSFGLNSSSALIVARSRRPAADVAGVFRRTAAALDPNVPLATEVTMSTMVDRRLAEERLFARVLSLLGMIGFVLAAVGLHGLISQMVKERSREFGIRIAIGADQRSILRLLFRQAAVVTIAGIALGLAGAAFGGKLIEASLFGVTSRDPLVYAGAAGLLLIVVVIALIGPARAALGIQPTTVLKTE